MKIAVSNLLANPFRHLERYPINEAKVDALVKSINDTTFWDNLLLREAPNKPGKFEMAYGHHRWKALLKAGVKFIDVPVRDLSDTDMARIMAHENMEEWSHNTLVEQETLRAIVEAFAQGRIELPKVKRAKEDGGNLRYAPSFLTGATSTRVEVAYSAATLTEFLGWLPYKVETTLASLALIEKGTLDEADYDKLSTKQAKSVAEQTRYAEKVLPDSPQKKQQVRGIGKAIAQGFRQSVHGHDRSGKARKVQDVTIHTARQRTDELIRPHITTPKVKKLPNAHKFIEETLRANIDSYPSSTLEEKLKTLLSVWDSIEPADKSLLVGGIRRSIKRQQEWLERFEAATKKRLEAVA